jgi:GTP-sensing pleiotropic transcriptional regulator CodY
MLNTLLTKAREINEMLSNNKIDYLKYKAMKQQVLDETDATIMPIVANYFVV